MSKEVKKAEKKNNKIKKQNIDIKKILNKILDIIKKYYYILILALPFILIDLFTKILGYKIHFYGIMKLVPILFTLSWIFFVLGTSLFYKKKIGKTIYIIFFIFLWGPFPILRDCRFVLVFAFAGRNHLFNRLCRVASNLFSRSPLFYEAKEEPLGGYGGRKLR